MQRFTVVRDAEGSRLQVRDEQTGAVEDLEIHDTITAGARQDGWRSLSIAFAAGMPSHKVCVIAGQ